MLPIFVEIIFIQKFAHRLIYIVKTGNDVSLKKSPKRPKMGEWRLDSNYHYLGRKRMLTLFVKKCVLA
jgi:hypothetical protein